MHLITEPSIIFSEHILFYFQAPPPKKKQPENKVIKRKELHRGLYNIVKSNFIDLAAVYIFSIERGLCD